jgi:phosphonate transport system substrate-binding protein
MTESTSPALHPESQHAPGDSAAQLLKLARSAMYLCIAAVALVLAYAAYQVQQARSLSQQSENALVHQIGVIAPTAKHLAPRYTDKQGRLLADPPMDPSQLLDPDTIVVAYAEDSDLDVQPIAWNEFQTHLAQATGKNVEMRLYRHTGDDVAAIRGGKVHVAAVHAADAPYLVNTAGLIPVAVVGTDAGAEGNHLLLSVANNSPIRNLADLKGRVLTCTMPASITGYRAAATVLLQKAGLRPGIDYTISFSGGQKRSTLGLAAGDFEAAALSDDKVQSLLADGTLKESDFRIIYKSEVIPRFTIGYVYNLQPALAEKISEAIVSFPNDGGPIDENTKPYRFYPTDYQRDFGFMRKIDESFDPRLRPNEQTSEPASDRLQRAAVNASTDGNAS